MSYEPGVLVMCLGGTPNLAHRKHAGTIHRIDRAAQFQAGDFGDTTWHLDPPTITGGVDLVWSKAYLRIIRDPGEDARDETLDWLQVPSKEHA
jgi:hypothetical protein